MNLPYRYTEKSSKVVREAFGGLDRRKKGPAGSFSDMKNMSGDEYKSIVTRRPRGKVELEGTDVSAMVTTDVLIGGEIKENAFILDTDDRLVAYYKSDGELKSRDLISTLSFTTTYNSVITSGGYMYFFPDKKYINLMNTDDFGSLEKTVQLKCGAVEDTSSTFWYETVFEKCDAAGNTTSDGTYTKLRRTKNYYTSGTKGNALSDVTIAHGFTAGDTVEITGSDANNGYFRIVYIPVNEKYIVLDGGVASTQTSGTVSVGRTVPDMDYVIASGNRLWGCKYGVDGDGCPINEIYASALGDPKNWYKFQGVSTDSYAASIGVDGVFTGACEYLGSPIFFKEDAVIRVYGDTPSNFSVTTLNVRGVEKESSGSVANVSGNLIYKSHSGFVIYNSGNPVNIDYPLGKIAYKNAVAGTLDGKYYVSAIREDGECELLVFDLADEVWHKEDSLRVKIFSRCGAELYMLTEDDRVLSVKGSGGESEEAVSWSFETGDMGTESHLRKAILTVHARMEMPADSRLYIDIEYDGSGKWQRVASHKGKSGKMNLRLKPRRTDTFRLRFSGEGEFSLYSLTVIETECSVHRGKA